MIRVELVKGLRRLRTWILLGALMGLPVIATIATHNERPSPQTPEASLYQVATASALNNALVALLFMSAFFLVIVASLFFGDAVAGEAAWGSLRAVLLRPVSRLRLLLAKFVASVVLSLLAVAAVVTSALVAGWIAFGWGPVQAPIVGTVFQTGPALLRLAAAIGYVTLCLCAIGAIALLFSTLADIPAGAAMGAVGVAVGSQILGALPALDWMHPYLLTTYWSNWTLLFLPGAALGDLAEGVLAQVLWLSGALGLAVWWFRRKDVLS